METHSFHIALMVFHFAVGFICALAHLALATNFRDEFTRPRFTKPVETIIYIVLLSSVVINISIGAYFVHEHSVTCPHHNAPQRGES